MKQRIDTYMVSHGLAQSRQKAQSLIEAGGVTLNGKTVNKPSVMAEDGADIQVIKQLPFVGRGGLKLLKALECFHIDLSGLVCADIGASTGGFTDCMLKHNAAFVYAVDSGTGQLDESLKARSDVCSMEGVNAKDLCPEMFSREICFIAVDVSFISLKKILIPVGSLLQEGRLCVCLIKPQFEAGSALVGKNGVVRDRRVHKNILKDMLDFVRREGFEVLGLTYSPVRGGQGNIEYLMCMKKKKQPAVFGADVTALVDEAFKTV